ncbi:MAG: ATP-binding protein, partial [Candidatus Limnocylindria bacterium]
MPNVGPSPVARQDSSAPSQPLVERETALGVLGGALAEAANGSGRVVFIGGEPGIGKTALVRAFSSGIPAERGTRVLVGFCDGVSTPRPLAPMHDMRAGLGPELVELLRTNGQAHAIFDQVLADLGVNSPTVMIIEDLHWADDATLDLVRFLGRRVESLAVLLVGTYRDEAGGLPAPLLSMLGDLLTLPRVERHILPRLSSGGVAALAAGSGIEAAELHRLTGGNPYFVTEVLAAGTSSVPESIADSTRARIARLDDRAREALDAAAIIGTRIDPWLLAAVAGEQIMGIDDCLRSALLTKSDDGLAFSHELTRLTVLEDMPVFRGIAMHRRALDALRRTGSRDASRLAYHAEGAADAKAVLGHAVAAGRIAIRVGAYREAVAQLQRAERFASHAPAAADVAALMDHLSYALFLINHQEEAYAARHAALLRWRRIGDQRRIGDSLRWLSRLAWIRGRGREARDLGAQALRVLEPVGDSHELAMAISNIGHLAMLAQDADQALAFSARALEMGERIHDPEAVAHALNNIGSVELAVGQLEGAEKLQRSAAISRERGFPEHLDRALYNLTGAALSRRDLAAAAAYL